MAEEQREVLARVNKQGLEALTEYLRSGEAVAFLGAGTSAPLYPLWAGLIGDLVDAAADRLGEQEPATLRALAAQSPEEVVEIVRRRLGSPAAYQAVLRQVLRVRTDPESGRTWTPVQELVCRCNFKAVVTTNYDPGIVDARPYPDAVLSSRGAGPDLRGSGGGHGRRGLPGEGPRRGRLGPAARDPWPSPALVRA